MFWSDRPEPLVVPGCSVLDFLHHFAGGFVGKPTIHEIEDRGSFEVFVEEVFDCLDCDLHVCRFAQSANNTSFFSRFLRFIFHDRRNSLKQSEQDVSANPFEMAELSLSARSQLAPSRLI